MPWKLDLSNQFPPNNFLTLENQITSGDGLFNSNSENR